MLAVQPTPTKKRYKYKPTNLESENAVKHLKKATIKKVKEVKRDFKPLDKTLINESPLSFYLKISKKLHVYRRKECITAVALELLLFVYTDYIKSGESVNSYGIAKQLVDKADCSIEAMNIRSKLNTLVDRGLLVKGGRNKQKAYLYFPSVKCIEDLQSILNA